MTQQPATETIIADLSEQLRASFPVEPLPGTFWNDGAQPAGDIPDELARRMMHRRWIDITLCDWRMIGPPLSVSSYLHPDAFRYYLPSLLLGVLHDTDYVDWAIEPLGPAGRKRRTDRPGWVTFREGFSETQRDTMRGYLKGVRTMLGETADAVEQHLFDELDQSVYVLHHQQHEEDFLLVLETNGTETPDPIACTQRFLSRAELETALGGTLSRYEPSTDRQSTSAQIDIPDDRDGWDKALDSVQQVVAPFDG